MAKELTVTTNYARYVLLILLGVYGEWRTAAGLAYRSAKMTKDTHIHHANIIE